MMKGNMEPISRLGNPTLKSASVPVQSSGFWLLTAIAFHLPLAYVMRASASIATLHALATVALGLWFIVQDKQPFRLIYLTGYIIGAEVLWRMTRVGLLWEYDKYAVSFLILLAMMRWRKAFKTLPLIYGLLLLPAAVMTVTGSSSIFQARSDISFNLSGPFALTIAALFFSGIEFNRRQLRQLLLYTVMPIAGIGFLVLIKAEGATMADFASAQSNTLTSGGFAANQVSAILGLGALLCWVIILTQEKPSKLRWVLALMLMWFLGQAFLTFSRGGVVNFLVAASLATPFLAKKQGKMLSVLLGGIILVIFVFLIIPRMDRFTGGALTERFSDTGTTGRYELIMQDLKLWQDNFLLGVGPGRAAYLRGRQTGLSGITSSDPGGLAAHTEYSRLLSEHGLLGLVALLLLLAMFFGTFFRTKTSLAKGLTLAFMLWSLAEMSHAAMRLAAISYFFALPFAGFKDED
jgi:O-antigen ligase